jgi:signal peptidase I
MNKTNAIRALVLITIGFLAVLSASESSICDNTKIVIKEDRKFYNIEISPIESQDTGFTTEELTHSTPKVIKQQGGKYLVQIVYNSEVEVRSKSSGFNFICTLSMYPMFDCSDDIIIYKPDKTDIKIGDILSYDSPETTFSIIHQVMSIEENYNGETRYIMKGLNNDVPDSYMPVYEDINFKVASIIRN